MGRRARQLLEFLERLDDLKIDYVSLRDGGHLTGKSASARMFRHMLVGMAEYESNLISERTRAALDAKRARGETWGGRKPGKRYKVTPEKLKSDSRPPRPRHAKDRDYSALSEPNQQVGNAGKTVARSGSSSSPEGRETSCDGPLLSRLPWALDLTAQ